MILAGPSKNDLQRLKIPYRKDLLKIGNLILYDS
jgi:hypothetical protein